MEIKATAGTEGTCKFINIMISALIYVKCIIVNTAQVSRMKTALYAMFCGDALSMPVHWYYSLSVRNIFSWHVICYSPSAGH